MPSDEKTSFFSFFEENTMDQDHPSWSICKAAATGNIGTLAHLVSQHPDLINESHIYKGLCMKPIAHAVFFGENESIRFFVRHGVDINLIPFGRTLFHVAAQRGHESTIEALVLLGATTMDVQDVSGNTPMLTAVIHNQRFVVETLARLGSLSIDVPSKSGWTPLYTAVSSGNCGMVATLLRLGSRAIDFAEREGRTPIYAAASTMREHLVTMLFTAGSQAIDTQNSRGRTPLFAAVLSRDDSMIEHLVRLGSQALDTPTKEGETPMQKALQMNHLPCVKVLMALGAHCQHLRNSLSSQAGLLLDAGIDESEVAEIRYRVYFGRSLVGRLLLDLERQENLRATRTTKLNV